MLSGRSQTEPSSSDGNAELRIKCCTGARTILVGRRTRRGTTHTNEEADSGVYHAPLLSIHSFIGPFNSSFSTETARVQDKAGRRYKKQERYKVRESRSDGTGESKTAYMHAEINKHRKQETQQGAYIVRATFTSRQQEHSAVRD